MTPDASLPPVVTGLAAGLAEEILKREGTWAGNPFPHDSPEGEMWETGHSAGRQLLHLRLVP